MIKVGSLVSYGFSWETGRVLEISRRNGQTMAKVQDSRPPDEYGARLPYPRWVPLHNCTEVSE